jgi:hypothetical protein
MGVLAAENGESGEEIKGFGFQRAKIFRVF